MAFYLIILNADKNVVVGHDNRVRKQRNSKFSFNAFPMYKELIEFEMRYFQIDPFNEVGFITYDIVVPK